VWFVFFQNEPLVRRLDRTSPKDFECSSSFSLRERHAHTNHSGSRRPDGRSAGFSRGISCHQYPRSRVSVGMKFVILFWFTAVLSGCVTSTTRIDPRDFAVSTCDLSQEQLALAQTRAREYLNRYPSAAADVRFVAVIADSVFPSEVSDLWIKLGRSQTSSSAYLQRRGQTFRLWCVAVLDRSTLIPVTNSGYLLANTPARGEVVHLSGRIVLYVGRGI
jgi:hypothetical protein